LPAVSLACGFRYPIQGIERSKLTVRDWVADVDIATREQFPVVPAAGINTHKLQSCSVSGGMLFLDYHRLGQHWGGDYAAQRRLLYVGLTRVVSHDQLLLKIAGVTGKREAMKQSLRQILDSELESRREMLSQIRARNALAL
jgi:hypothetical protein